MGYSFSEAETVFADPLALTGFDPNHSDKEDRFITMGIICGTAQWSKLRRD